VGSIKLVALALAEFVPAWNSTGASDRPLPLLFGMGVLLYILSTGLHYASLAAEESRPPKAARPRPGRWPARPNCRP